MVKCSENFSGSENFQFYENFIKIFRRVFFFIIYSIGFLISTHVFNSRRLFVVTSWITFSFASDSGSFISILYLMLHISNFSSIFLRPPLHFSCTFKETSSILYTCLLSQPAMHIYSFSFISSLYLLISLIHLLMLVHLRGIYRTSGMC